MSLSTDLMAGNPLPDITTSPGESNDGKPELLVIKASDVLPP